MPTALQSLILIFIFIFFICLCFMFYSDLVIVIQHRLFTLSKIGPFMFCKSVGPFVTMC